MPNNHSSTRSRNAFLKSLGAELTEAVYPVMLRYGAIDNWLDLQLELWKAIDETVKKWDQEWPSAGVMLMGPCNSPDRSAPEQHPRPLSA
jgi:hypothetical protein